MADYYSLLSRAVANLPKSSPASARRAIYDRARKALIGQLRSLKPALPESDIAREENALDVAVSRIEAEFEPPLSAAPSMPTLPSAKPLSPAPRPPSVSPRPLPPPAARPSIAPARPPIATKAPTLVVKSASAPQPASPPVEPLVALGAAAGNASVEPAATVAPRVAPQLPSSAAVLRASFSGGAGGAKTYREAEVAAPQVTAASKGAESDNAPRIAAPLDVDRPHADADASRPGAPSRAASNRNNPWPLIALALVVGLAGSIAVFAFLFRERPQDLAIKDPIEASPSPTDAPAANGQKIVERVGGASTPTPGPVSTPSDTPTPAQPAAAATTAVPTAAAAAVPTPTASSAPMPAPSTAATVAALLPVTARAAMLVATTADAQKPAVTIGTVVWSSAPALAGQPGSVGVKADIDIPDLKMHAIMTLRKNTDASLPASHTIDLRLTFDEGSPIKGVKDIDLPRMRRDDSPNADPLLGVKVKINDSYFLIGLNRADADVSRNIDEIATRGWFDFPLLLNDDRIAKLTFEKAADGDRIVNEALAAWK